MVELFFSYSHRDEALRDELEIHLAMLKRQGVISAWHDRRIGAGKDFENEVGSHLESSDIILLLVSPYFLASDYCYDVEMKRALERHQSGSARVIPVILHPSDWQKALFGKLRATPPDGKPVSKFPNQHDAFLAITQDIRATAEEIARGRSSAPAASPPHSSPRSSPATGTMRGSGPRSSNLRIRHEFSDHERARFALDAFEYLAKFFENSLDELQRRTDGITTEYRRVDANRFTAGVFRSGRHVSSCIVWFSDDPFSRGSSEIRFSHGASSSNSSYNESLSVIDDGYTLGLRPLGLQHHLERDAMLTLEGAAECYWELLVSALR